MLHPTESKSPAGLGNRHPWLAKNKFCKLLTIAWFAPLLDAEAKHLKEPVLALTASDMTRVELRV